MSNPLDDVVKEGGFESIEEFHLMVSSVDLTKMFEQFKRWQEEDGSKDGLEKLLDE